MATERFPVLPNRMVARPRTEAQAVRLVATPVVAVARRRTRPTLTTTYAVQNPDGTTAQATVSAPSGSRNAKIIAGAAVATLFLLWVFGDRPDGAAQAA